MPEKTAAMFHALTEKVSETTTVSLRFPLAQVMEAHIREVQPGKVKPSHRHINEAIVYILQGEGYSIVHPLGGEEMRLDWRPGSALFVPSMALHGHVNTGSEVARYMGIYPRGPGMFYLYEKALREADPTLRQQLAIPDIETLKRLLRTEEQNIEKKTKQLLQKVFA